MAARSSRKRKDPVSCESLLQKLKKGQDELNRSIRNVRNTRRVVTIEDDRRVSKVRKPLPRSMFERPMNKVDDLPRKRARLAQLSPDYLDSFTLHEPYPSMSPPKVSKPHTRRLSSTPKLPGTSLSRQPPPSVDASLEEAILSKEGARRVSRRERKGTPTLTACNDYAVPLPSPKMSRIVVDTSREVATPGSTKKQRSFAKRTPPSSLTKRGKGKKRGLSVSFVQVDDDNVGGGGGREERIVSLKKRKADIRPTADHSVMRKDLGTSLIDSLNSSRYGALDRTLSQTRKQHRFPRKYAGDDPRLGYDWIAGLLDASGAYLSEKDDEYFNNIKEFRQVNYADCFRPREALLPGSHDCRGTEDTASSSGADTQDQLFQDHGCTTCVSSYMMNDRLFPVRVHPSSGDDSLGLCCPVCEGRHSKEKSPTRYIRVSVPRSVLQASSRVRPHRRRSFDPTDSMGLAKHCLAGWECAQPSVIPPQSTVDLKSSVTSSGNASQRLAQELLNTSHSVEYSLRSRASAI